MASVSPEARPAGTRLRGSIALTAMLVILLLGALQDALGLTMPSLRALQARIFVDPISLAVMLLAVVLLFFRRRVEERASRPGVRLLDLAPLAVAVLGVQIVIENAWRLLAGWTASPPVPPSLSAPLHRLGMGGALLVALAVLLLLVPRFRMRLWEYASMDRLRSGLYFTVAVLVVVYAVLLWIGLLVAGPKQIHLDVPPIFPLTAMLILGQAVIALGEEIFYRGMLQGEVSRVLVKAGLQNPRHRRLIALGAVSVLFALQHVGPGMAMGTFVATFLYAFCMSLLFGFLFELTGNLAVCALAHFFNNLVVLGLGPAVTLPGSVAAFGDGVYLTSFLVMTFVFLFLLGRDPSKSLTPIRPQS